MTQNISNMIISHFINTIISVDELNTSDAKTTAGTVKIFVSYKYMPILEGIMLLWHILKHGLSGMIN